MIGRNWATCSRNIASCSAGEEPTGSAHPLLELRGDCSKRRLLIEF
jgi:hypothetical protein